MNNRYSIHSEFVPPQTANLAWVIVDNATHRKVAIVYVFDGTAQLLCDMLNSQVEATAA